MVMFFSRVQTQVFGEEILRYFIDNLLLEGVIVCVVVFTWLDTSVRGGDTYLICNTYLICFLYLLFLSIARLERFVSFPLKFTSFGSIRRQKVEYY